MADIGIQGMLPLSDDEEESDPEKKFLESLDAKQKKKLIKYVRYARATTASSIFVISPTISQISLSPVMKHRLIVAA